MAVTRICLICANLHCHTPSRPLRGCLKLPSMFKVEMQTSFAYEAEVLVRLLKLMALAVQAISAVQNLDTKRKQSKSDPIGLQCWTQALCCVVLHKSIAQHVSIESLCWTKDSCQGQKAASTTSTIYTTDITKKRIQTQ